MHPTRLLILTALCTACGTATGGGGATLTPGTPCDTATQHELCGGVVRLSCVSGVWQALEVCVQGQMCIALPGAPGTGKTACAQITAGGDSDGGTLDMSMPIDIGSFDINLQADISSFDIHLQPDVGAAIDQKSGCSSKGECDDNLACTLDNCLNGMCQHLTQDAVCSDGKPCVNGKCNALSGCTTTPKSGSCDDGDACTVGDACKSGSCVGSILSCDDGNACTSDSCMGGGCQYAAITGCNDNTMDGASLLQEGTPKNDYLSPTGDVDFYKINGQKGQLIFIQLITAQGTKKKPLDPTIIDTVLTMYGPDQQPYAFDDDPYGVVINDSEIWTILPQDGTYWFKVEECWTYLASQSGTTSVCASPKAKSELQYTVGYSVLSPSVSSTFVKDAETGDNVTNATPVGFEKASDGKNYYLDILYGTFKNGVDADPFAVTPPLDVPVSQGRATLFVRGLPGGWQGNGSTCDPGVASIVIAGVSGVAAQADLAADDLEVPVKLGQKVVLMLKHGTGPMGLNDFYVLKADVADSGPLEVAESANDSASGAEILTAVDNASGGTSYFIAGDIGQKGADVDHFSFAIPSGSWAVSVFCASARVGSGVQGFQAKLLGAMGQALPGAAGVEADGPQQVKDLAVPSGSKSLLLKVAATGQSASVTGTHYRCTVGLAVK